MKAPPMGKLNPIQKLYYLIVLVAGFVNAASGVLIWLVTGNRALTLTCHLIHNLSFLLFAIAVPLHAYFGTLANPGTFRIMVYGTVPLEFAKKKYPKWMKEIGKM
jgi:formate dehydrogenase subunit gamma